MKHLLSYADGKTLYALRQRLLSLLPRKKPKGVFIYVTSGLLFAILLVLLFFSSTNATYMVSVDGEVLGYTKDKSLLDKIVSRLSEEEAFRVGAEVRVGSKISLQKVKETSDDVQLLEPDKLGEVLKGKLKFLAKGFVISVDGKDVVALSSEEEARGVLSDLRTNYIKNIVEAGHATVEEVLIKEKIDIAEKEVPTSIFRNRDEAARILVRGTDKIMTYVVQRGDSLWTIAAANHLTVDDLRKANPEIKGDFIREGQNLNLVVPNPYVTLASRETVTYKVSIPFSVQVSYDDSMWPWQEKVIQEGKSGEKEITEQILRENGKEVQRIKISEKIISYPVTKKIVRGSKQVPAMGSGQMVWPVQGSITSYFGWRWGSYHQGIDIGAPAGTPIRAADSGMVSFAGWNGGYGYLVKIDHGGGKETWYAHMSKIAVSVGQKVSKGEVIGYVGSTGNSTGPHLHFEVRVGGTAVNPLNYYK